MRYGENAELTTKRIKEAEPIFKSADFSHYIDIKNALTKKIVDQNCARAALDIALMDWVGKALNVPLFKLWGLDTASAAKTSFSIGIDTPEVESPYTNCRHHALSPSRAIKVSKLIHP